MYVCVCDSNMHIHIHVQALTRHTYNYTLVPIYTLLKIQHLHIRFSIHVCSM